MTANTARTKKNLRWHMRYRYNKNRVLDCGPRDYFRLGGLLQTYRDTNLLKYDVPTENS